MTIKSFKIKELRPEFDVAEKITTYPEISSIKISLHKNEETNIAEINFNIGEKKTFAQYSEVKLLTEGYDWHVASSYNKILDQKHEIYSHQLILEEKINKLELYPVSNLSFNVFISKDVSKIYANLYEVVARANRVTPFEQQKYILETRLITSYIDETDGLIYPRMTTKCETLLKSYTDVPEFQYAGRNFKEVLFEIFSIIGGSPKLIATEEYENVLDIELLDEYVGELEITDYYGYEELRNNQNYCTEAQLNVNNIVDKNSIYITGQEFTKHVESEQSVLDENIAHIPTDVPIYRLYKSYMIYMPEKDEREITNLVKSHEEYKIVNTTLPADIGDWYADPAIQNVMTYTINGSSFGGLGKTVKKNIAIFDTSVLERIGKTVGFTDFTDGNNYSYKFLFIPILQANDFRIKQLSFYENKIRGTININSGDRINESNKLFKQTQNKVNRLGARTIIIKKKYNNLEDIPALGTYITNFDMINVSQEIEIKGKIKKVTFTLTPSANMISKHVGVNSINRSTDVEIGKALVRNENYEDYIIFTTREVLDNENTSSLSNRGFVKALNLFENEANEYKHFYINSSEVSQPTMISPKITTGRGLVNFQIPLENQTYVNNRIIEGADISGDRLVERGVPYTRPDGLLYKMQLAYGYDYNYLFNDDNFTLAKLRELPLAQDIINVNSEPLFEIGSTTATREVFNQIVDSNFTKTIPQGFSLFVGGTKTVNFTKTYANIDKNIKGFNFRMTFSTSIDDRSFYEYFIVKIKIVDKFNNVLTYFNETFKVTEKVIANTYEERGETKTTYFRYINYENVEALEKVIINNYVKDIIIDVTSVTPKLGVGFEESQTFNLEYANYDYFIDTVNVEEGLIVDKNINEVLKPNYNLYYATEDFMNKKEIILGDALTLNSRFLYAENNLKEYKDFVVYSSNNQIGQYDSHRIIGTEIPNSGINVTKPTRDGKITHSVLDIIPTDDVNLYLGGSYSIVGIRKDDTRDFMLGVNAIANDVYPKRKLFILAKHFHTQEVR